MKPFNRDEHDNYIEGLKRRKLTKTSAPIKKPSLKKPKTERSRKLHKLVLETSDDESCEEDVNDSKHEKQDVLDLYAENSD